MKKPLLNKVVIFGVGLIGGSLVKVLKANHIAATIIGIDCDSSQDIAAALNKAELIILAVPPLQIMQVMQQICPYIEANTVLTDVCSVKQKVVIWAQEYLAAHFSRFVPAHPIAGSEQMGALHAKADLFQHKQVVITPLPETNAQAINVVTQLWQQCGAYVCRMTAQQHDKVYAWVSHLPHFLIFALLNCIAQQNDLVNYLDYVGSGFQDFTRIGKSNPVLWQEIAAVNRTQVIDALTIYQTQLQQMTDMLRRCDDEALLTLLTRGREQLG